MIGPLHFRCAALASVFALAVLAAPGLSAQVVLHAAPDGVAGAVGKLEEPLSFPAGLDELERRLATSGLPEGGLRLELAGGRYRIDAPRTLGTQFKGTAEAPIVIAAAEGAEVVFSGGIELPAASFAPVTDPARRARLAASAADRIVSAKVTNPAIVEALSRRVVTTLSVGGGTYLPAVFPNEGYASLADATAVPEVSPPAVPPGSEGYGVRAGNPPYQVEGRPQGWLGSPEDPRGAWARFDRRADERAGTWAQWQDELPAATRAAS